MKRLFYATPNSQIFTSNPYLKSQFTYREYLNWHQTSPIFTWNDYVQYIKTQKNK